MTKLEQYMREIDAVIAAAQEQLEWTKLQDISTDSIVEMASQRDLDEDQERELLDGIAAQTMIDYICEELDLTDDQWRTLNTKLMQKM